MALYNNLFENDTHENNTKIFNFYNDNNSVDIMNDNSNNIITISKNDDIVTISVVENVFDKNIIDPLKKILNNIFIWYKTHKKIFACIFNIQQIGTFNMYKYIKHARSFFEKNVDILHDLIYISVIVTDSSFIRLIIKPIIKLFNRGRPCEFKKNIPDAEKYIIEYPDKTTTSNSPDKWLSPSEDINLSHTGSTLDVDSTSSSPRYEIGSVDEDDDVDHEDDDVDHEDEDEDHDHEDEDEDHDHEDEDEDHEDEDSISLD